MTKNVGKIRSSLGLSLTHSQMTLLAFLIISPCQGFQMNEDVVLPNWVSQMWCKHFQEKILVRLLLVTLEAWHLLDPTWFVVPYKRFLFKDPEIVFPVANFQYRRTDLSSPLVIQTMQHTIWIHTTRKDQANQRRAKHLEFARQRGKTFNFSSCRGN